MATRISEEVAGLWKVYKADQSNQNLRNKLIKQYYPLVC